MSKSGEVDFQGAIFVCHKDANDVRTHGPFWLIEEALQIARLNSLVYKTSAITPLENDLLTTKAPSCKWISKTCFIPNPDSKTSVARASKIQALARLGPASAYQAAIRDAMTPSNAGNAHEKLSGS